MCITSRKLKNYAEDRNEKKHKSRTQDGLNKESGGSSRRQRTPRISQKTSKGGLEKIRENKSNSQYNAIESVRCQDELKVDMEKGNTSRSNYRAPGATEVFENAQAPTFTPANITQLFSHAPSPGGETSRNTDFDQDTLGGVDVEIIDFVFGELERMNEAPELRRFAPVEEFTCISEEDTHRQRWLLKHRKDRDRTAADIEATTKLIMKTKGHSHEAASRKPRTKKTNTLSNTPVTIPGNQSLQKRLSGESHTHKDPEKILLDNTMRSERSRRGLKEHMRSPNHTHVPDMKRSPSGSHVLQPFEDIRQRTRDGLTKVVRKLSKVRLGGEAQQITITPIEGYKEKSVDYMDSHGRQVSAKELKSPERISSGDFKPLTQDKQKWTAGKLPANQPLTMTAEAFTRDRTITKEVNTTTETRLTTRQQAAMKGKTQKFPVKVTQKPQTSK